MKMNLCFLIILSFLLLQSTVYGVHSHEEIICESEIITQQSFNLNGREQIELQLGRKLNFKERIALTILKSDIKKNGKKALHENNQEEGQKTHGLAIAGFIVGIVSLFFAGVPFGIVAIVFSAISLSKINKSGGKLKGKGFAIAGFVLGIVGVIGAIVALSLL